MAQYLRSFRIFGNFTIGKPNAGTGTKPAKGNCLEIFHIQQGDEEGQLKSLARIRRIQDASELPELPGANLPDPEFNIFSAIARDLIARQLEQHDDVLFWMTEWSGDVIVAENRLVLRGAIWLDQFGDALSDTPSERFPLVSDYHVGQDRNSRILFGNGNAAHYLRLELGFAVPAPIGLNAADAGTIGGALALGGIYPTSHAVGDNLVEPEISWIGHFENPKKLPKNWLFGDFAVIGGDHIGGGNHVHGTAEQALPHIHGVLDSIGHTGQTAATGTPSFTVEFRSAADPKTNGGHIYAVACRRGQELVEGPTVDISGSNARLDIDEHLGGKLQLNGRHVTVEAHWLLPMSDDLLIDVLSDKGEDLDQPLHVSLRFDAEVTATKKEIGPAAEEPLLDGKHLLLRGGGLEEALRLSNNTRQALVATDRQPQSILPSLFLPKGNKLSIPLIAYADGVRVAFRPGGLTTLAPQTSDNPPVMKLSITPDTEWLSPKDGAARNLALRHLPEEWTATWNAPLKPHAPLNLWLILPGFNDSVDEHDPEDHHTHIFVGHDPRVAKPGFDASEVLFYAIANGSEKPHLDSFETRLGSIAFFRRGWLLEIDEPGTEANTSGLAIGRRHRPARNARRAARPMNTLNVTWRLSLAADEAVPVTTDIPHSVREERPNDLLISETPLRLPDDIGPGAAYFLRLAEQIRDDQDRHLTANLHENTSLDPNAQSTYTVLAEAPFSAYRFSRRPLGSGDGSTAVATFDSDDREWRLQLTNEHYRFTRPAGSVGEDADKPGMLELHDPKKRTDLIPPAPPMVEKGPQVPRRHAVDMRLSPPTTLWVQPSDLERNYFLPEYAARELFRQRGDFGLGVQLTALRSELIYGLPFSLRVPEQGDARPTPRVAELQALTGRMARRDPVTENTALAARWRRLHNAFRHRPEKLEVWTLDTRSNDPFIPAKFRDGVNLSLRHTALLAPPVADVDRVTPSESAQPGAKKLRFHERGLSGGAIWPLESANVTRVLAANPASSNGEIDGIELSPMGDSGNQTARFLNGYVTIISETRDGFLQKHRVEVLGRVGCLWHRAKHVVVYERTTAASPQFVPFPVQESRSQRPILRKVEEFVEILEPARRYPDITDVPARTRGCLEEVRFNSTIIHVNSAWGEDVGDTGWRVPLWNRGEAELRPQVYPFPDVAFVTTGEAGGLATQECLDLATTYFYTDAVAGQQTVDTNQWPPRFGIDTTGLGHPKVLRKLLKIGEYATKPEHDRRSAANRVPPGIRQFTWRLAPSPVRSQINAERGDKPIFCGLASVTLVRDPRGPIADGAKDAITDAIGAVEDNKDALAQLADLLIPLPRTRENAVPGIAEYDAVVTALDDLVNDPKQGNATKLKNALAALADEKAVKAFDAALSANGDIVKSVQDLLGDAKSAFDQVKAFDEKDCEAVAAKAAGTIRRRKLLILQMIRQARTEYVAEIGSLAAPTRQKAKQLILEHIQDATKDAFDQANENLGDVRAGVATARAVVADWRTDVHVAMDRSRARLAALRQNFDSSKPWSRHRVDKVFTQLSRELDAVEREAFAALDEARLRMATEISASANGVTARVAAVIERVLRSERQALAQFDNIAAVVAEGASQVLGFIDKIPPSSDISAKLTEMDTKVENLNEGTAKDNAKETMTALRKAFEAADLDNNKAKAKAAVEGLEGFTNAALAQAVSATGIAADLAEDLLRRTDVLSKQAHEAAQELKDETVADVKTLAEEINGILSDAIDGAEDLIKAQLRAWADETRIIDEAVAKAEAWIVGNTRAVDDAAEQAHGVVDQWFGAFEHRLELAGTALNTSLWSEFEAKVISPVVNRLYDTTQWPDEVEQIKVQAIAVTDTLADDIEEVFDDFVELPLELIKDAKDACIALVGIKSKIMDGLEEVAKAGAEQLKTVFGPVAESIDKVIADFNEWTKEADAILAGTEKMLDAANEIGNQIAEAGDSARAYIDRGAEILSRAGQASPGQLPGLALQLISAATQAPEIAAFRANADRIRVLLDETRDVLETPAIRGLLDQLGDGLKSIGLDFSFKEFGDQFLPDVDGERLLRKLIPDCGINIEDMLRSAQISDGSLSDAIKVSHDLDAKTGRAWVQADVNVPLPGREPMFTIGPFTLFLKDTFLTAFMRAEASKDQEDVALSDRSLLQTTIEAVVAGQVMVTLEDVEIRYSSRDKLDFTLDPTKIRIHQTMRFIQDTLGSIFGDDAGGLQFIKEGGVPVGVEHKFVIPPISLMYGTSGVSNIQISNRFSLRAYPDFIISNRFNLSRRELPFIFSVFIIGGTGYIQVDADYRPFDKRLVVAVEAGVGGSAAFGFALGPVTGGVFISLSVVLRYQKTIGEGPKGEDGLSVSLVLVIAGTVSLWGIVSIYLGLMLSIRYHESGQMDGLGQLSVEVRISRFFKLKFSTQVKYKLRDGRSSTETTTNTSTSGQYQDALKKYKALDQARKSL